MEQETHQGHMGVAGSPDGVVAHIGTPPSASHGLGGIAPGLVGISGDPLSKEKKTEAPALVITISIMVDGSRSVDAKAGDGSPVPFGKIREALRESKEHFDDRVLAQMVRLEARRVVAEAAAQTKDRNLWARLRHALH